MIDIATALRMVDISDTTSTLSLKVTKEKELIYQTVCNMMSGQLRWLQKKVGKVLLILAVIVSYNKLKSCVTAVEPQMWHKLLS